MTQIIYETHATGHWKELFKSKNKLLGAHNLASGEELCATISHVGVDKVYDKEAKGEKELVVVCFANGIPPMALNITNSETIAMLHGNTYTQWQGKQILIHAQKVKAFGKEHDALRVRPKIPRNDDVSQYEAQLRSCKNMQELQNCFVNLPKHVMGKLTGVKDQMKEELSNAGN